MTALTRFSFTLKMIHLPTFFKNNCGNVVYVCILLCFELLDFFFVRPVLFYFTVVYKNCTSKLRWINEENVIFGEIYTFKREISLEYKEIYFQNLRPLKNFF
jgi:hypothetical protein